MCLTLAKSDNTRYIEFMSNEANPVVAELTTQTLVDIDRAMAATDAGDADRATHYANRVAAHMFVVGTVNARTMLGLVASGHYRGGKLKTSQAKALHDEIVNRGKLTASIDGYMLTNLLSAHTSNYVTRGVTTVTAFSWNPQTRRTSTATTFQMSAFKGARLVETAANEWQLA